MTLLCFAFVASARLPPADVSIWWSLVAVETDCTRWHSVGVLASGLQVVELSYNSEGTGWEADHLILGGVPMVYNGVKFGVIESLPGCGKKPSMMVVTVQGALSSSFFVITSPDDDEPLLPLTRPASGLRTAAPSTATTPPPMLPATPRSRLVQSSSAEPEAILSKSASSSGELCLWRYAHRAAIGHAEHVHVDRGAVVLVAPCHGHRACLPVRVNLARGLTPPTPPTLPICISRPASAACCAIALLPSSLPRNRSEVLDSAGLCAPDDLFAATTAAIAQTPPLPPLGGTRDTTAMLGDEVAVVAVTGDVVVDSGKLPLVLSCMWHWKDWQNFSGQSRRGTLPDEIVQFGACEVDRLCVARGIVVFHRGRRRFLEHRQERRIFTMLAQLSPIAGNDPSRDAIGEGKAESRATGEARKVGNTWTRRPRLDGKS